MTRVLLVSETLHPFCWPLALTLKEQQYEVTILTSKNNFPMEKQGIQIISCFEKWSLKEFAQLLPILVGMRPQIVHFIQPSKQFSRSWNPAFHLLAVAARVWPQTRVVTSILDISEEYPLSSWLIPLLQNSDLVTASSETLVTALKIENKFRNNQICKALPPLIENDSQEPTEELAERAIQLKPYIFVPCRWMEQVLRCHSAIPMIELVLKNNPELNLVFAGSWENVPLRSRNLFWENPRIKQFTKRILILGENNSSFWPFWIKNCEAVFPAFSDLSRPEIWLSTRSALELHKPLVLTEEQVKLESVALESGRNCWVLHDLPLTRSLSQILNDKKLKQLTWTQGEFGDTYQDDPGNRLSRLYVEAQLES